MGLKSERSHCIIVYRVGDVRYTSRVGIAIQQSGHKHRGPATPSHPPKYSSKMFSSKTLGIFNHLATSAPSTPLPPRMHTEAAPVQDVLCEQESADFADVSDWRHLEAGWCMFEAGVGYSSWVQSLLSIKGLKVGPTVDRPCSLYCHYDSDSDSGLSEDELINPNLRTSDTDLQSDLSEDELLPPGSDTCVLCR